MSRIISGKLRLDVRTVDLIYIVNAAIDSIRPAADAKGIRLQPMMDPSAGPISGDADRLQQIVWNLLTNAVKFTPKNGKIQVTVQRIDSHVEIVVTDSGVGISKEFLPYVFDRFRQADASTTRIHGGLGLGLSIVRQLVDLHGGSVSVESEGEGKGATFTITLPFVGVISNQKEAESINPAHGDEIVSFEGLPSLQGLKVLVVDDEADTRELISEVLKECGSEVVLSHSVAEALEALEQHQARHSYQRPRHARRRRLLVDLKDSLASSRTWRTDSRGSPHSVCKSRRSHARPPLRLPVSSSRNQSTPQSSSQSSPASPAARTKPNPYFFRVYPWLSLGSVCRPAHADRLRKNLQTRR